MRCLSCGANLADDSNFCTKCGLERSKIINRIGKFPEELRNLVELVIGNLAEASDDMAPINNEGLTIKCTDNVYNVPETMKGKIYAAGSVSFAPTETYFLELCHKGKVIRSALFKNTAVIRRENGDDKCIAIYTDQADYKIRENDIGYMIMREISREPVVLVRFKDEFYIFCPKKEPYLSLEGRKIPPEHVETISVNQRVELNSNFTMTIKLH